MPLVTYEQHPTPTTPPTEPSLLRRRISATALAVTLISIPGTAMYATHDSNPVRALGGVLDDLSGALGEDFCPQAPSRYELAQIESSLDHAPLKSDEQLLRDNGVSGAELTHLERMIQQETSAQRVTQVLSGYTQTHFGYVTHLAIPESKLKTSLDLPAYKRDVVTFAHFSALLSPSLQRAIGIQQLTITNMMETSNYHLDGQFKETPGNTYDIALDINSLRNPITYAHEMIGHGPSYRLCEGRIGRDTAITSQNPPDFEYGAVCHKTMQPNVIAIPYGGVNLAEDQATIGALFVADGGTADTQLQQRTAVGRKLGVILARWEKLAPGSSVTILNARPAIQHTLNQTASSPAAYIPQTPAMPEPIQQGCGE